MQTATSYPRSVHFHVQITGTRRQQSRSWQKPAFRQNLPQTRKTAFHTEYKNTIDTTSGPHKELRVIIFKVSLGQMEKGVRASAFLHSHFHRLMRKGFDVAEPSTDRLMRELLYAEVQSEGYRKQGIVPVKNNKKRCQA